MIKKACPLFGLILTACLYNVPEPQPTPLSKESTRAQINVRFQQAEEAKEGQLFVCGLQEGEFWCLDYETFNSQLRAR